MAFPEIIRIRGERGLASAMTEAARRERTTTAEWARRKLRDALKADGFALPPFGENDDGPGPFSPAPGQRAA